MTRLRLTIALAAALALPVLADAWPRTKPVRPVLVELFTAQGCEGCPQADLALGELAKKKGVIALSFSVDVWDYTGWTDTLAQPEFTLRQKAYVKRFRQRELSTPEVVVDGAAPAEGLDQDKIAALTAKAARAIRNGHAGPSVHISADDDWAEIGAGRAAAAQDVWMIRYDPKPREVKVKLGDNRGKTVVVSNAVRELARLGAWRGHAKRFDLPEAQSEGLKTLVIVQGAGGGPVLALGRH